MPLNIKEKCSFYKLKIFFLFILCLCFCNNFSFAKTKSSEIIRDFKDLQGSYLLPTSTNNFNNDQAEKLKRYNEDVDTFLYKISEKNKKVLSGAYKYLNENKNNPNIKKTRGYQSVLNIGSKVNNFRKLETRLRDDGCINSASSTVRKLSFGLLQGSIASINSDDCSRSDTSAFLNDIDSLLDCIKSPEKCENTPAKPKGILSYQTSAKNKMIEDILLQKKRKDKYALDVIDYNLTGKCNAKKMLCRKLKKLHPLEKGPLHSINSSIKRLKSITDKISRAVKVTVPDKYKKNSENYINNQLDGFRKSYKKAIDEVLAGPLRFASQSALEKCVPNLFNSIQDKLVAKRAGVGRRITLDYEVSVSSVKTITAKNLKCIQGKTKKDYEQKWNSCSRKIQKKA